MSTELKLMELHMLVWKQNTLKLWNKEAKKTRKPLKIKAEGVCVRCQCKSCQWISQKYEERDKTKRPNQKFGGGCI